METLERVVHVDDDEDIRTITRLALELVGKFQVTQFASARDAIAGISDVAPQVFLLDVMMPGMTGVELWKKLRTVPALADVPTIFMTAKAEKSYAASLIDQGAAAVITKPFDPTQLCQDIREIWQRVAVDKAA